jgi:hypothetical protein
MVRILPCRAVSDQLGSNSREFVALGDGDWRVAFGLAKSSGNELPSPEAEEEYHDKLGSRRNSGSSVRPR